MAELLCLARFDYTFFVIFRHDFLLQYFRYYRLCILFSFEDNRANRYENSVHGHNKPMSLTLKVDGVQNQNKSVQNLLKSVTFQSVLFFAIY